MTTVEILAYLYAAAFFVIPLIILFYNPHKEKVKWKDCETEHAIWKESDGEIVVVYTIQRNQNGDYRLLHEGHSSSSHPYYGVMRERKTFVEQVDLYKHLFKNEANDNGKTTK